MEGPQTPSSGAAVATAQPRGPRASAEHNKNSLPAHAGNTEAADQSGVHSGGAPGSRLCVPIGGCPGQAETSPSGEVTAPQGFQERKERGGWEAA